MSPKRKAHLHCYEIYVVKAPCKTRGIVGAKGVGSEGGSLT